MKGQCHQRHVPFADKFHIVVGRYPEAGKCWRDIWFELHRVEARSNDLHRTKSARKDRRTPKASPVSRGIANLAPASWSAAVPSAAFGSAVTPASETLHYIRSNPAAHQVKHAPIQRTTMETVTQKNM